MSPMGINQGMKVHQFARGFWEHEPPSLTLGCKRLRPLAPKLPTTTFDLKSFIRPESGSRKTGYSDYQKKESAHQVEAQVQPGGTRWNPTQEQIGILEMLYRGGMRTPNAQQIEQITVQLAKYGKIEGKNVFYWFQNHKARERQKQKRTSHGLGAAIRTPMIPPLISTTSSLLIAASPKIAEGIQEEVESNTHKRKCSLWAFDQCIEQDESNCTEEKEEVVEDRTLNLFPLHPEGISRGVSN